jgi:hypothetical protein
LAAAAAAALASGMLVQVRYSLSVGSGTSAAALSTLTFVTFALNYIKQVGRPGHRPAGAGAQGAAVGVLNIQELAVIYLMVGGAKQLLREICTAAIQCRQAGAETALGLFCVVAFEGWPISW